MCSSWIAIDKTWKVEFGAQWIEQLQSSTVKITKIKMVVQHRRDCAGAAAGPDPAGQWSDALAGCRGGRGPRVATSWLRVQRRPAGPQQQPPWQLQVSGLSWHLPAGGRAAARGQRPRQPAAAATFLLGLTWNGIVSQGAWKQGTVAPARAACQAAGPPGPAGTRRPRQWRQRSEVQISITESRVVRASWTQ